MTDTQAIKTLEEAYEKALAETSRAKEITIYAQAAEGVRSNKFRYSYYVSVTEAQKAATEVFGHEVDLGALVNAKRTLGNILVELEENGADSLHLEKFVAKLLMDNKLEAI